jgi:hypothetical protein
MGPVKRVMCWECKQTVRAKWCGWAYTALQYFALKSSQQSTGRNGRKSPFCKGTGQIGREVSNGH